jgi:2-keto-3-deoxy-L-rhamnonate aldolase RhmA
VHNTVTVQVPDRNSNLIRQLLDPGFGQLEIPELNVVEEVLALHVFKDDVVVVRVLE